MSLESPTHPPQTGSMDDQVVYLDDYSLYIYLFTLRKVFTTASFVYLLRKTIITANFDQ